MSTYRDEKTRKEYFEKLKTTISEHNNTEFRKIFNKDLINKSEKNSLLCHAVEVANIGVLELIHTDKFSQELLNELMDIAVDVRGKTQHLNRDSINGLIYYLGAHPSAYHLNQTIRHGHPDNIRYLLSIGTEVDIDKNTWEKTLSSRSPYKLTILLEYGITVPSEIWAAHKNQNNYDLAISFETIGLTQLPITEDKSKKTAYYDRPFLEILRRKPTALYFEELGRFLPKVLSKIVFEYAKEHKTAYYGKTFLQDLQSDTAEIRASSLATALQHTLPKVLLTLIVGYAREYEKGINKGINLGILRDKKTSIIHKLSSNMNYAIDKEQQAGALRIYHEGIINRVTAGVSRFIFKEAKKILGSSNSSRSQLQTTTAPPTDNKLVHALKILEDSSLLREKHIKAFLDNWLEHCISAGFDLTYRSILTLQSPLRKAFDEILGPENTAFAIIRGTRGSLAREKKQQNSSFSSFSSSSSSFSALPSSPASSSTSSSAMAPLERKRNPHPNTYSAFSSSTPTGQPLPSEAKSADIKHRNSFAPLDAPGVHSLFMDSKPNERMQVTPNIITDYLKKTIFPSPNAAKLNLSTEAIAAFQGVHSFTTEPWRTNWDANKSHTLADLLLDEMENDDLSNNTAAIGTYQELRRLNILPDPIAEREAKFLENQTKGLTLDTLRDTIAELLIENRSSFGDLSKAAINKLYEPKSDLLPQKKLVYFQQWLTNYWDKAKGETLCALLEKLKISPMPAERNQAQDIYNFLAQIAPQTLGMDNTPQELKARFATFFQHPTNLPPNLLENPEQANKFESKKTQPG